MSPIVESKIAVFKEISYLNLKFCSISSPKTLLLSSVDPLIIEVNFMLSCRGSIVGECRAHSWRVWLSPVAICFEARYRDILLVQPIGLLYFIYFFIANWCFLWTLSLLRKKSWFGMFHTEVCCVDDVLPFLLVIKVL